jgi:hypothetical protein
MCLVVVVIHALLNRCLAVAVPQQLTFKLRMVADLLMHSRLVVAHQQHLFPTTSQELMLINALYQPFLLVLAALEHCKLKCNVREVVALVDAVSQQLLYQISFIIAVIDVLLHHFAGGSRSAESPMHHPIGVGTFQRRDPFRRCPERLVN